MTFLLALMPWLIGVTMAAVLGILISGVVTMGRHGADRQRQANRLMRWRVGTQLAAVLLVGLYVLLLHAQ